MKLSKFTVTSTTTFALALTLAACGGGAATETAKTNSTQAAPVAQSKPETATKTATSKQSTPTEAGESFFNSIKNKDKAVFKNLMSKDSIEILEAAASEKKMTLDDLLDKQFFPNTPMPEKCEQRNEKITGDKAITEMKSDKNEWSPMTFVKENNQWKVSME